MSAAEGFNVFHATCGSNSEAPFSPGADANSWRGFRRIHQRGERATHQPELGVTFTVSDLSLLLKNIAESTSTLSFFYLGCLIFGVHSPVCQEEHPPVVFSSKPFLCPRCRHSGVLFLREYRKLSRSFAYDVCLRCDFHQNFFLFVKYQLKTVA